MVISRILYSKNISWAINFADLLNFDFADYRHNFATFEGKCIRFSSKYCIDEKIKQLSSEKNDAVHY